MRGNILVVSGPSGSGKSSLLKGVLESIEDCYFSISVTTRSPREGEIHGREYFFIDKQSFEKDIEDGMFLEWAKVHDNYYGTSLKPVFKALKEGKIVIFDIDVQGHKIIREKLNDLTTSVFITTPSQQELQQRLEKRGTDSDDIIERRVNNAIFEMTFIHDYDYILINDDLTQTMKKMLSIAEASRCKVKSVDIDTFITSWTL